MIRSVRERYEALDVDALLRRHSGLRIVPNCGEEIVLRGPVSFHVAGPHDEAISDNYDIELRVPRTFPDDEPTARETSSRIPSSYHKLNGKDLCLGAPTAIRFALRKSPTLLTFVDKFIIPYLFGHSYFDRHGKMPFGELDHGAPGIRQHLRDLFAAPASQYPEGFLQLAGMKTRPANKHSCPCGSGRRLGRCHNRRVNDLRRTVGRTWFRAEYPRVKRLLDTTE